MCTFTPANIQSDLLKTDIPLSSSVLDWMVVRCKWTRVLLHRGEEWLCLCPLYIVKQTCTSHLPAQLGSANRFPTEWADSRWSQLNVNEALGGTSTAHFFQLLERVPASSILFIGVPIRSIVFRTEM